MFLGRYGFDVDLLHNTGRGFVVKKKGDRATVAIDGKEYPFLTVHQAKGLEAESVILLNCTIHPDATCGNHRPESLSV